MKISYVVPHKNRTGLFAENLKTLLSQTDSDFEIIVVDASDSGTVGELRSTLNKFREKGLDIKCYTIDPTTHPLSHPKHEFSGQYNPALAQNIGVRKASGEIICLTSPEVINATTNIENAKMAFSDGGSKFVLGWIDEKWQHEFEIPDTGLGIDKLKGLCATPNIHGAMCRSDVPARPWLPINYFLGFIRKDDFIKVGGIDERFMGSVAYEDNFFAHCCEHAGMPAQFNDKIAGIHLSHSRGYQSSLKNSNADLWNSIKNTEYIANNGASWGDFRYITGEI